MLSVNLSKSRSMKDSPKLKIRLGALFSKFGLEKVRINAGVAQAEFTFETADEDAAWELYVEMLTRIVTQPLPLESGDEKTALESVYSLFPTTRKILCQYGRKTVNFSKVAIPILNQVVRPFTTKWHKCLLDDTTWSRDERREFCAELDDIQKDLRKYNRVLAKIACVEDLTDLEQVENT